MTIAWLPFLSALVGILLYAFASGKAVNVGLWMFVIGFALLLWHAGGPSSRIG